MQFDFLISDKPICWNRGHRLSAFFYIGAIPVM